jgi:hypothetical protein
MILAEQVGGIGVSVMVFKTAYETALDDMGVALANVSAKLEKLQGDLRKGFSDL